MNYELNFKKFYLFKYYVYLCGDFQDKIKIFP
jgi:hypothetical protein